MKTPTIPLRSGLSVRFETAICDRHGRLERILQRGTNMITDWGMDNFPATLLTTLVDYLHLGSSTETLKRVLPGGNAINLSGTDPAGITVTADSNFFESGDVGRSLKIAGWPELLVTGYTSELIVTARSRASLWPPGFTPPGTGPFTDVGIHYTNSATLGAEFTRFNTKDSGASNNNAELNDSANSRIIQQKIFLSAEVAGSPWTVNQLGWGTNTTNCFGKTNLGSPDTVAVGKKYRVVLQVLHAYTPIDLSGVTLDWGGTVGSYTCDIRQERIGGDFSDGQANTSSPDNRSFSFLRPKTPLNRYSGWWTGAFTLGSIAWLGGAGYTSLNSRAPTNAGNSTANLMFDSTYVSGDFRRTRTARWADTENIVNATGLFTGQNYTGTGAGHYPCLTIKPTSGTITKASGFRIDVNFAIVWQRSLVN